MPSLQAPAWPAGPAAVNADNHIDRLPPIGFHKCFERVRGAPFPRESISEARGH